VTLALTLSVIIGLLLGLLGGGGSILTVPMLVYVLHIEPKTSILMSFAVVGFSSLIAIIQHARKGHVCWKSGIFFGLSGMAGAFGGGRLTVYFSDEVLMGLFGLVTLVTGLAMLRGHTSATAKDLMREHLADHPVNTGTTELVYLRLLIDGFVVGGLTGLVGVGGGFLIVPALTLLVGLPMQTAVGTSLLVIVMNAVAGFGGHIHHASLDLSLTGIITAGAIAGSVAGGWLSGRISAKALRRMFGVFVILVACYVLYHSLTLAFINLVAALFEEHIEFFEGVAALTAALILFRIRAQIHRLEGQDSRRNHKRIYRPGIR
jgi:uncharacterized membrane protein YfcA